MMRTRLILARCLRVLALVFAALLCAAVPSRATEQFANTSTTTLAGAITSGATTLTVTAATSFPTTGTFRIRIDSEILIVTAVSGTTFTVTRAGEGTTAAAHAAGAGVYGILTAGALAGLQSDTLSSAALSASGLYVPLAGNPAVLQSLAIDPSLSTLYATQGAIRTTNAQSWYARNAANNANLAVLGTDASNNIVIGDGTNSADVWLHAKAGSALRLKVASTDVLWASSTLITAAQAIALGTGTVATTGAIRAPNATTIIAARNAGNTADIQLLGTTAGGSVTLGDGTNALNANLNVPSGNWVVFQSAGNNALVFTVRHAGALTAQAVSTVTSVTYNQTDTTSTNATGAPTTVQAQNSTGTGTTVGGALTLTSGSGATPGNLNLQIGGTTRLRVDTSGTTFNSGTPSYGGGAQVLFIANRTTAPSSNPTAGGILWADSGELLYRSSAGNVSNLSTLRYGTFANRPTVTTQGSQYFATDGHTPWVSDTSGTWHPLVGGQIVGTAPPAAASFTAVNQGTSTIADSNGALKITGVNDGATPQMHHYCVSATTQADATIVDQPPGSIAGSTFSSGCVELRESSSSKFVSMCMTVQHANQLVDMDYDLWSASTTRTSTTTYAVPNDSNSPVFIKLAVVSTNIVGQYSRNRIDWTTVATTALTTAFTTAPNQACLGVMGFNVAPVIYVPHFASN